MIGHKIISIRTLQNSLQISIRSPPLESPYYLFDTSKKLKELINIFCYLKEISHSLKENLEYSYFDSHTQT